MSTELSSTESEDLKFHATSRNRKRLISNGSSPDAPQRKHHPSTSKRHHFDSSSDDDVQVLEQAGSSTRPHAANGTRSDPAEPKSDNDVQIIGSTSKPVEEDPWSRLEEYSALLAAQFPDMDPLAVQDALIQNDVSLVKAQSQLRKAAGIAGDSDEEIIEMLQDSSKKPPTKPKTVEDEESEDEKQYQLIRDNVYDSDDSDYEDETDDRKQIVTFLQEASLPDLIKLRGLSERKAKFLIQARPFLTWKQTIHNLRGAKYLSLDDIIDAATDYLNSRTTVSKIIHRCQKLSAKVEDGLNHQSYDDDVCGPPKMLAKGMKLQGYQLEALQWLTLLHKFKMNGILADEMGLGKTIQSIAFLASLIESGIRGPFLIVAPASTIDNWDDEFRRWTPSVRTVVYHGSLEDRAFLRDEYFSVKGLQKVEVIITTYDGATRNPIDKVAFKRLHFKFAIFDEAHLLKNMATNKYKTLMNTVRTDGRLLLTGTPVQNNLTELLSLLVFAMPQLLARDMGSLEHAFTYITKEGNSPYEAQQIVEAKAILKPFILRRTKEDVALELPGRTATVERVPMSASQKALYEKMVRRYSKEIVVGDNGEEEYGEGGLAALHQMRKLANHPLLSRSIFSDDRLPTLAADLVRFHPAYKNDTAEHLSRDLEFMSDFQLHKLCCIDRNLKKYRLGSEPILDSGKFEYFDTYLPLLKEEGHRILLFSQYVQVLDIVESYLEIRKHKFARIDGQTPVAERQDIVDRFNTDDKIFIMLLSTRAGGLGINLTGADTVIIHDIDFNPYNDKQAENRCHRLGQKKEVAIFRLVSKDTIEEQIFELGQKKLELERNVMDKSDAASVTVSNELDDVDVATAKSLLRRSLSTPKPGKA
ncbi:SWI/SNF-related matrix-associated actin-dependent regulator of chromatin subfamily A containing DEAD/H box 1 homolog [Paramacrobiotus metropolitanus]|uniref:SWI/SNF-related matrix-associated actin-dependent regulator of chromatin subfamily A containing DEAD/H box 1 homolog n=1 Tax=Paramacrobiotus metropolitanus TaxID=2943436 RepID=UPI0024457B02|nr:SWI/SNF-related matrix-associated actin-dependent regulator of chromatin subfamily A containing DEAD/H box 1 homolog [Paramacrobiotus metropolitanus]